MTDFNKVFVDTAPYIYFLNHNDNFYVVTKSFFEKCMENDIPMITSVITTEEYLVMPYRNGNEKWVEAFRTFLNDTKTEVLDIDNRIAEKAAKIRANYEGFKAMDALQLASAVAVGADLFLTNDKQLRRFEGIKELFINNFAL